MNHEKIAELLPWYVNGTLTPDQRAAVESELASCPLCAADLAELQRVHHAMHEIEKDAPGPSEFLLARTLARAETQAQAKPAAFALRTWWESLSSPGKIAALVPAALALALLFIAVRQASFQPRPVALDEVQSHATADTYQANAPVPMEKARTLGSVTTRGANSLVPAQAGAPQSAAAPAAPANETAVNSKLAAVSPARFAAMRSRPQLIRTGSISLLVPDVERAVGQLSTLARMQFGDVVSLNDETPSQPGIRHTAQVQISVPSDRFDDTMTALAKLGAVQTRSINAENVTDQIVDAQARLRNLRRTEADMLRIMDRAGKIPDVLEVTQQIADVRQQIEQLDAQLQSMQHQVAYSAISISVEDEKPIATVEPGMGTQLNDAWKTAVRKVEAFSVTLASAVLTLVAFAPYWLAIAVIALVVANRLRRNTSA